GGDRCAAGGRSLGGAALREPKDRSRVRLLLGAVVYLTDLGRFAEAEAALTQADGEASRDRALETQVDIERGSLRATTEPVAPAVFIEAAERAIPVLEESGDHAALARAWWLASWRGGAMGDYEGGERAARRSLEHARLAGDRAAERAALAALTTVVWGPMPVIDGLARLNE